MFKNFVLSSNQRKINALTPKVNINLHKEMPTPCLEEAAIHAPMVSRVNAFSAEMETKPDEFFKAKTAEYKKLLAEKTAGLEGKEYAEIFNAELNEILPYYYAMVREAGRRVARMRHFDVQILGGVVLNNNQIAEMVTGEGKTLVATLPAALNALSGKGVHVVTVNDYLARRDKEWMGPIYEYLGFSVGVIQQEMENDERRAAYACDITYGTNNEFGFDYLRDNMKSSIAEQVQRGHFFAIVDEVDSILIDEARTPLIISGPAEMSTDKYYRADKAVRSLKVRFVIQAIDSKDGTVLVKTREGLESRMSPEEFEADYDAIVEEKANNAYLTPRGEKRCEKFLSISSISDDSPDKFSNPWNHYLTQSLRAHHFFHNDKEYIAKEGKVIIVDEFTGRLMPGRRWSDGLHQAVEAKEGLKIQEESQTLATITLQNYFRMYAKLAGMTGTAYTEAGEFKHIYKLDTQAMPTNRTLVRVNFPDRIYKNKKAKFAAVVKEIQEFYGRKQPVLVGTISIEDSEEISFMLSQKGVTHNVLNAKYHEREAHIVAQAGRLGQVTIATNMAGRGTDIILGGNLDFFIKGELAKNEIPLFDERWKPAYEELYNRYKPKFDAEHEEVVKLGGLHIIGTQRHEARRIDNQLRGRSGRQGDPGSSRFYVSLEDDLMRLFGSERIYFLMDKLGFPEEEPIEHAMVSKSLEIAQKRVEAHNFEIRKHLLEYDNVMNKQREVIYQQRKTILEKEDIRAEIMDMIDDVICKNVAAFLNEEDGPGLASRWLKQKFGLEYEVPAESASNVENTCAAVQEKVQELYQAKEQAMGASELRNLEKMAALWVVDSRWKENLLVMDSLKEGIHLRGYAHTEPLVEYQKESHAVFQDMIEGIKDSIVDALFKFRIVAAKEPLEVFDTRSANYVHPEYSSLDKSNVSLPDAQVTGEMAAAAQPKSDKASTVKRDAPKVGRNDPCPCGSGKKYKKCCGR